MKKTLTLSFLLGMAYLTSTAQNCTVVFNLRSPLDSIEYYLLGPGNGFISGNNVFGDSIKGEGFPAIIGDTVISAYFGFAYSTINTEDSAVPVNFYVWDNSGTDLYGNSGGPGYPLDSASTTLGQIAQALSTGQGIVVNFPNKAVLETDTFYVGVVLPSVDGDTLVLLTNTFFGPDGDGYEYNSAYGGWGSYNDDWIDTMGSLGNLIQVQICGAGQIPLPSAGFTPGDTTGCAPSFAINFNDTSSNPNNNEFFWTFGSTGSTSNEFPSYTFTGVGTYTVTERVYNAFGADSATSTVTINPAPVNYAGPNVTSCSGAGVAIGEAAVNGYSYSWSPSTGLSSTSTADPTSNPTDATTYTVTETINATGCSATFTTTVDVATGPTAMLTPGDASSDTSDNGSVADSVTGGTPPFTYSWSNDSTTQNLTNVAPGTYSVVVTDANNCSTSDTTVILATGIITLSNGIIVNIYPNPASDILNIAVTGQIPATKYVIFDVSGKQILAGTLADNVTPVNISSLASGVYMLRLGENQSQSIEIVKEK